MISYCSRWFFNSDSDLRNKIIELLVGSESKIVMYGKSIAVAKPINVIFDKKVLKPRFQSL